jgi:hypothetical protein
VCISHFPSTCFISVAGFGAIFAKQRDRPVARMLALLKAVLRSTLPYRQDLSVELAVALSFFFHGIPLPHEYAVVIVPVLTHFCWSRCLFREEHAETDEGAERSAGAELVVGQWREEMCARAFESITQCPENVGFLTTETNLDTSFAPERSTDEPDGPNEVALFNILPILVRWMASDCAVIVKKCINCAYNIICTSVLDAERFVACGLWDALGRAMCVCVQSSPKYFLLPRQCIPQVLLDNVRDLSLIYLQMCERTEGNKMNSRQMRSLFVDRKVYTYLFYWFEIDVLNLLVDMDQKIRMCLQSDCPCLLHPPLFSDHYGHDMLCCSFKFFNSVKVAYILEIEAGDCLFANKRDDETNVSYFLFLVLISLRYLLDYFELNLLLLTRCNNSSMECEVDDGDCPNRTLRENGIKVQELFQERFSGVMDVFARLSLPFGLSLLKRLLDASPSKGMYAVFEVWSSCRHLLSKIAALSEADACTFWKGESRADAWKESMKRLLDDWCAT